MSFFDGIAQAVLGVTGDIFGVGGTCVVERSHDLRGLDAVVVSSLLAAQAGAGAVTLSLRLPGSVLLEGGMPAGLVLTISGQGYTVAAPARAEGNLLAVSIAAPGLVAPVAEGTPVALAPSARFELPGSVRNDDLSRLPPDLVARAKFELVAPKSLAPDGFAPRVGDTVIDPRGVAETLIYVAEPPGAWQLLCGGE